MNLRKSNASINEKRLLSVREGADYTGIGVVNFRIWAEQIGAVRRIGSRVLFDKTIIDRELDRGQMDECTNLTYNGHPDC